MAMEKIDLVESGLNGGDGGKGALTAISRTPHSQIELGAVGSIRLPSDRQPLFAAILDDLPPDEGGKQYKLIYGRRRLAAWHSPHIPAKRMSLLSLSIIVTAIAA